jgi:hypothetical protein
MARVSTVNGITIAELLEYAYGAETHSTIMNVDRDVPRSLIGGWHRHAVYLKTACPRSTSAFSCPMHRLADLFLERTGFRELPSAAGVVMIRADGTLQVLQRRAECGASFTRLALRLKRSS